MCGDDYTTMQNLCVNGVGQKRKKMWHRIEFEIFDYLKKTHGTGYGSIKKMTWPYLNYVIFVQMCLWLVRQKVVRANIVVKHHMLRFTTNNQCIDYSVKTSAFTTRFNDELGYAFYITHKEWYFHTFLFFSQLWSHLGWVV